MTAKTSVAETASGAADEGALIRGRIDAIDGCRMFGWVYDERRPADRLTVEVTRDGVVVATALADRSRIDLRRNGIGDGGHAFDLALSDDLLAIRDDLEVAAASPTTGEREPLRMPAAPQLAAEAMIATPLAGILDRLEIIVATQRRLILSQRDLLRGQTADDVPALDTRLGELSTSIDVVKTHHGEVDGRFDELDVFLLRFETTLAALDARVAKLDQQVGQPLRHALLTVCALSFVATAVSIVAIGVHLVRH